VKLIPQFNRLQINDDPENYGYIEADPNLIEYLPSR